jgi:hypothetical protein
MSKVSISRKEWTVLKEMWMASSGNGHDFGCVEDMRTDAAGIKDEREILRTIESLQVKGIVKKPLSRSKIDGKPVTQFVFTDSYKVEYEEFTSMFSVSEEGKTEKKAENTQLKKGGHTMAHLSAYDKARQQLKADGVKTDQSTTKQSLMASLTRSSNPTYKKMGQAIKDEMEATKAKRPAKKAKAKKAPAKKAVKAPKAKKKAPEAVEAAPAT